MRSINKVTLFGRAGADADERQLANGQYLYSFPLVTKKSFKKPDGNFTTVYQWTVIRIFGNKNETYKTHLLKDSFVFVEGELSIRTVERDGNKKLDCCVTVSMSNHTVNIIDSPAFTDDDLPEEPDKAHQDFKKNFSAENLEDEIPF